MDTSINLNHLRYFYVTAQLKSVTKAAELLHISQPSLSQQLAVFEEKIGFPLYYRNGRNLDVTPKGKVLFDKAVGIFSEVESITNFIQKRQPVKQNLYSIAVCDEIERPFISDIVGQLVHSKISENYKYDIISKSQYEIASEFYSSKYNLFITNQKLKKSRPFKVFEFPVNLVTSRPADVVHKLKNSSVKGMFSGLGEKLVLPSYGLSLREELDHFLDDAGIELNIAFESNILGCVTRAVKQKVGCSFLPVPYVYEDLKHKKISVLGPQKGFWQHKIYVYSKANLEDDPVREKITSVMQSYLNLN